jgi:transposase
MYGPLCSTRYPHPFSWTVPASFVVIRHVRTKLSCTKCDCIVQAEAPSRPIERGGAGMLAHVLVSKYCDHQPLYRQSEIESHPQHPSGQGEIDFCISDTSRMCLTGRPGSPANRAP